ncbi:MAG: hypothetical protein ACAH79_12600 [Thermoleophilia bacterium]
MKRLILVGLVTLGMFVAPTAANASSGYTGCSTGAGAYTYTRGGYEVAFSRYQGRGMACSSVRYVINKWLRPKVARQYSWPRVAAPFYDGWVRWHCWKLSRPTVQCDEFTSNTSLRFAARVY